MKKLAIGFSIAIFLAAALFVWLGFRQEKTDVVAIGSFIVLTLTLLVLVWYAYDTNSIARITADRWTREGVLGAVYSLELVGSRGDVGRTLVRIHNPSTLVVRARLNCNFEVYGRRVSAGALYDGTHRWVVFPQQLSQGWFEIDLLLHQQGTNVTSVMTETTSANRETQLTMNLSIDFEDELGAVRKLPSRLHYFDFERWAWIPRLGEHT